MNYAGASMEVLERSPLLAIAYAVALYAFAYVISRCVVRDKAQATDGRYGTLDGLRGLLALGVLVHHSVAAYGYFTGGQWAWGKSAVLNQLGQSTVAIFFMITGYLFAIKAAQPAIEWRRFYINRAARLVPLYFAVVLLVLVLVFAQSNWQLRVGLGELFSQVLLWLAFVCFGRPDINGHVDTWVLIAGVNWSLAYEVYFYIFAVPVLHFGYARLGSSRMSIVILSLCAVFLIGRGVGFLQGGKSLYITQFLSGAAVSHIRSMRLWQDRRHLNILAVAAVCSLAILGTQMSANNAASIIAAAILLLASAKGLTFFGLLKKAPAIWLGDISYGIYLLHGLVLVGYLSMLAQFMDLQTVGAGLYFLIMLPVVGAVVILSSISYRWLELPVMRSTKKSDS